MRVSISPTLQMELKCRAMVWTNDDFKACILSINNRTKRPAVGRMIRPVLYYDTRSIFSLHIHLMSSSVVSTTLWMRMGFPASSVVKNPPAMQETWVWSLCWEDPLEKEMATCSNILTWRISWTEKLGRLQSIASHRVRHDWSNLAYCNDCHCSYT